MKKKILLLFPQGIGDMMYVVDQLLLNIKFFEKKYEFTFIIQYKQNYDLLKEFFKNNKFKVYYSPKKIFEYLYLLKKLCFKRYDFLLIDPNINTIKASIFSIFINSKIKIFKKFTLYQLFFNKVIDIQNQNRHKQMFELSKMLSSIDNDYLKYEYKKFNLNNYFNVTKEKKNIIGVAPGSGSLEKHKRWPKEYFVKLLNLIISENRVDNIFLFGSEDENNLLKYLESNIRFSKISIFNKNIIISLKNLKRCKLLIANDNGMVHAAQCLKIDHVTITGPSYPDQFVDKRLNNFINLNLPCSPCYKKKRFGCGNEICLKLLSPEKVKNKIYEIKKQKNIF